MTKRALLVFALLALSASVAYGQAVVRIRSGEPARPGEQANPDAPAVPVVAAIEPSKEEAAKIADLIEQLGAPRLAQRERAMAELAAFEARALRQVREGKEHQDDEIANRCEILETVIQNRQGELFLAAKRLGMEAVALDAMLRSDDVKPLLAILKSRAQPGMTPVWARVLGKLATRPQVIPAAQLCVSIEGLQGYGVALAEAARGQLMREQAQGLFRLAGLIPPASAADAIETLSFCAQAMGGAEGVQGALSAAGILRGTFPAADALAAARAPDDPRRKLTPEGEGIRQAASLCLAPSCALADIQRAGLPALSHMSPLALAEYLALLRRSGLGDRIEAALVSLVAADAPARSLNAAGSAWAGVADAGRFAESFAALPIAAQLGALDALWLNPREPAKVQPFLLALLEGKDARLAQTAARMLGQYRAPSTARALCRHAIDAPDTAQYALESLAPMADLLPQAAPELLGQLGNMLPDANLAVRAPLIAALGAADHKPSVDALMTEWKLLLPRSEMAPACTILAGDGTTPAGALAWALAGPTKASARARQFATLDQRALVLMRALLAASPADGFAVLRRLASDEASPMRPYCAMALSWAEQEGTLVADWIRRLAGEIPDKLPQALIGAVGLSRSKEAEDYRQRLLGQGAQSPNMQAVLVAVYFGRSKGISFGQLCTVLFDTPANARQFASYGIAAGPKLPADALKNIATALLFAENSQVLNSPDQCLFLAESNLDVLGLLFGADANATPSDPARTTLTALLGDPARSGPFVDRVQPAEDGSNWDALQFARAWLGKLDAVEAQRLIRGEAGDPTLRAFTLRRAALAGDAGAMRAMLDRFSSQAGRFADGATAGVEFPVDRNSGTNVSFEGVAFQALGPVDGGGASADLFRRYFGEEMPDDWDAWWTCRRALLQPDMAEGKYKFVELP